MRADPVDHDLNQHLAAIDAETAREIFLENLQEEIKTDPAEKARLALLYAEAQGDQFFEWAAEKVLDEMTPAFEGGWNHE